MAGINDKTTVELDVNGEKAKKRIVELTDEAQKLKDAIKDATIAASKGDKQAEKNLPALRKQLADNNQELKVMQSRITSAENVLKRLDKATPKELKQTLNTLNKQLNSLEHGSSAWNKQVQMIKQVKAQLKTVNDEMALHETFLQRLGRGFNEWGNAIMTAAASVTGLVMAGKKAVSMYAEMDQEMSSVRKYTGMTAEEVEHLNEEFKKIDTRSSRESLNKLAQEAGRLGLQSEEDVLGFVRAADKINVALDELGEGATLTLSKLTDIFGDKKRLGVEQSLLSVGSVINELSQNCTASAPYLATFAQRMAGVGAQAGLTVPQIMAFGAVLDSQGQAVEMSASALSKLTMNLFKNSGQIAKATGLDVKKFKETAVKDTNAALIMLLERLHELGNMDVLAPMFKEMGENGVRSSQVLAALAGNIDMVKQQQIAANIAFEEATSIQKEFDVQNTNVQARLDKARKGFKEMAITLGKELMPVVSHCISGTSMLMRSMLKTIQFVKEHRTAIVSLAAGIAAYTVVVEFATIKTKLQSAAVAIATAAQRAWNAAIKANPWGAIAAVVVAATAAIIMHARKVRELTVAEKAEADARKKISEQYNDQRAKVDMLNAAVHNETLGLAARKKALEELQSLCPDYHASLTEEGKLINDNTTAIDNYLAAMEKEIQAQIYREKLEELYRKRLQAEENVSTRQADYDRANADLAANGGKMQMRTSMGAAAPMGGVVNSYVVAVQEARGNLEGAKKQLSDIDNAIQKIGGHIQDVPGLFGNAGKSGTGGNGIPSAEPTSADDWNARQVALANIAYANGETKHEEYQRKLLEIDIEYRGRKLKEYEEGSTDYLKAMADEAQAKAKLKEFDTKQQEKLDKEALKKRLAEENLAYEENLIALQQSYVDGRLSNRAYQTAMEEAELQHLDNIRRMYEDGSKEQLKAEENYQKRSLKIQERRFKEQEQTRKSILQSYMNDVKVTNLDDYDFEKQALDSLKTELLQLAKTEEDKLAIEYSYQEARYQIAKKYNDQLTMEEINAGRAACDEIIEYLNTDAGKALTSSFQTLVNGMGQIFSGLTDLINAETDIQTESITKRYDAEIKAAEGNETEVARLEQEKQEEIAKVKNEASQKEYAMQVIQTIAQTAIAALNAYSSAAAIPMVGWIMAPLAAAMAVAAGGIQLAALKKQQEAAASQGYAKGRKGGKAEYALIGEEGPEMMYIPNGASIIPNNKLQSPEEWEDYGVPMAQRTNTVGNLSSADVSGSITANQRIARVADGGQLQSGLAAQTQTTAEASNVLKSLTDCLSRPIYAVTTIEGDKGIKKQQNNYERCIRNKSK